MAQNLYLKYGFAQSGLRRAYYSDNREDAAIMTTSNIGSAAYSARLTRLKEAYAKKRGPAVAKLKGRD